MKSKKKRPRTRNSPVKLPDTRAAGESRARPPFFVVGLGASAGGLEALGSFFDAMPADSGMAFVVIQHLSPDHKSMMAELLSRHTPMPVSRAEDGARVEPNHVYLIPPKKCLQMFDGKLLLTDWNLKAGPNLPIDIFFSSLAEDCGDRAIGIALSGTGSDGTRGVRAIKEAGGLVMIQDEESAKFAGMPHSAIATGLADYILPAEGMPKALLSFIHHPLLTPTRGTGLRPAAHIMQKIEGLVRAETGIDFSGYKQSTVLRRLERRIGISQVENASQYLEYLQQTPAEVGAFAKDLLISVTKFFRDREAFDRLREEVIPAIFSNPAPERAIRVWVAGCATGEEAYSIGILLQEHAATLPQRYDVKIFASDVNREAIQVAGAGVYPASIAADVPPDLLARYFIKTPAGYRISQGIRDQIIFAAHNILKDPPFTRLDLVSCRNLLIYLQPPAQRKLLSIFHFALRPQGCLFLGSSETVGEKHEAFEATNARARIFQKRGQTALDASDLTGLGDTSGSFRKALVPAPSGWGGGERPQEKLRATLQAKLIADFAPTCFAVNDEGEILYSFGRPERFIALGAGEAHLNLLKLVPPDLAIALATALRQARERKEVVRFRGVQIQGKEGPTVIDLKVEPTPPNGGDTAAVTLVFLETGDKAVISTAGEDFDLQKRSAERIGHLEEDLQSVRHSLQMAIEEREASMEELQSTNEELIASNEELQSSNEELESINEELSTLNTEFQEKNNELKVAHDDLNNFLRTSQIGTIFLDDALKIRKFTPLVATEMNLLPQDLGRALTDLAHPLVKEMNREARRVLHDGMPAEKIVEARAGVWYSLRISPYRREGASDRGVVVTLVDVSTLKKIRDEATIRGRKKQS